MFIVIYNVIIYFVHSKINIVLSLCGTLSIIVWTSKIQINW